MTTGSDPSVTFRAASPHGTALAVFEGQEGVLGAAAERQRAERAV